MGLGAGRLHRRGRRHSCPPARPLPGGRVRREAGTGRSFLPPDRAFGAPHAGRRPRGATNLEGLRTSGTGLRARLDSSALCHLAAPRSTPVQSDPCSWHEPDAGVQHRDQLRHRNQLAGLLGRDAGELPDPDGRACGGAVHCRRRRTGSGVGGRARRFRCNAYRGQLLGRSHPRRYSHSAPGLSSRGSCAHQPGGRPEPPWISYC